MKDALTQALTQTSDDASVDRILATSFFRTRPHQAGTTAAAVIRLDERRTSVRSSS
jgi:hypothetical protein